MKSVILPNKLARITSQFNSNYKVNLTNFIRTRKYWCVHKMIFLDKTMLARFVWLKQREKADPLRYLVNCARILVTSAKTRPSRYSCWKTRKDVSQ